MESNPYNHRRDTRSIVSVVLGIIGIVWGFFLIYGPLVAIGLGIAALVLAVQSRRRIGNISMNLGGLLLGIVSMVLGVATIMMNYASMT